MDIFVLRRAGKPRWWMGDANRSNAPSRYADSIILMSRDDVPARDQIAPWIAIPTGPNELVVALAGGGNSVVRSPLVQLMRGFAWRNNAPGCLPFLSNREADRARRTYGIPQSISRRVATSGIAQ